VITGLVLKLSIPSRFLVFNRLHGRKLYAGSGIGLSLCRRIVNNHHGQLYAESEVGRGPHIFLPERQDEKISGFTGEDNIFPSFDWI